MVMGATTLEAHGRPSLGILYRKELQLRQLKVYAVVTEEFTNKTMTTTEASQFLSSHLMAGDRY